VCWLGPPHPPPPTGKPQTPPSWDCPRKTTNSSKGGGRVFFQGEKGGNTCWSDSAGSDGAEEGGRVGGECGGMVQRRGEVISPTLSGG